MAQRRMFSLQIVDTDAFLEMPVSSQLLYFHLSMRADDDGFVANPKKIMRTIGVGEDDLKVLLAKRFVLGFDSGVLVIKHWRMNNYIQNDRYKETAYLEEKSQLQLKDNGSYTECIQDGHSGKVSIGKISLDKVRVIFKPPTLEEVSEYCKSRPSNTVNPEKFISYYESNGWLVGKNKMKDWRAAVRTWEQSDKDKSNKPLYESITL